LVKGAAAARASNSSQGVVTLPSPGVGQWWGADMCRAKVGVHWDYPGGKTRPVSRSLESSPLIQGKVTSGGHRRSSSFIVVILFTSKQNKSAVKAMYSGFKRQHD